MIYRIFACLLAISLLLTAALEARAHAVINEGTAVAGSFSFITLRITHGCGTSPTNQIRMKIPDGVIRVSPRFMENWTVEKRMKTLGTPYEDEAGNLVTETVDEIVWSGGSLPAGYYGEFQVRALMPDSPGETLWFKTIQNCQVWTIWWFVGPHRVGQTPFVLKVPSAFIRLVL